MLDNQYYSYRAFGFHIQSTMRFLTIHKNADSSAPAPLFNLFIHQAECIEHEPMQWQTVEACYRYNEHEFQYWIDGLARFRCIGQQIWIEHPLDVAATESISQRLIEAHLFGAVLSALIHRHGLLALHANAFQINGQVGLLCGPPSVGKSTLAAALYQLGAGHVADDLTCIEVRHQVAMAHQGVSSVALAPDMLDYFAVPMELRRTIHADINKTWWHNETATAPSNAAPVKHIYLIERSQERVATMQPLQGVAAFHAVKQQLFRAQFVCATQAAITVKSLMQLVSQCSVWQVAVPVATKELANTAQLILSSTSHRKTS